MSSNLLKDDKFTESLSGSKNLDSQREVIIEEEK